MRIDPSRLGALGLSVLFVWFFYSVVAPTAGAVAGFVALIWRRRRDGRWGLPRGLWYPVGAFLGFSLLAALASEAPWHAAGVVAKEAGRFGLLGLGLAVASPRDARAALACLLAAASVVGLWSVYQWLGPFGGALDNAHRAHGLWHAGAFVSYGNALVMVFGAALGLLAVRGAAGRALPAGAVVAATVGMVLSYTRSAWLAAFVLATGVFIWRRAVLPLVAVAAVAGAVLVVPATNESTEILGRAKSALDSGAATNLDRMARWRVALDIARDHPLLGVGPGALGRVYPAYAPAAAPGNSHLHNTYLQLLTERGPLALGGWLAVFGLGIVTALRVAVRLEPERAGVAAAVALALCAMLIVAAFNYVWEDWRIRALSLALLGLAWSPAVAGGPEGDGTSGTSTTT